MKTRPPKAERLALGLLAAAVCQAVAAQEAQDAPEKPTPRLPQVTVTAPKEARAVATPATPEDLPALRASTSDTASLLRDVPGVSLYGAGGVSSLPVIHGLADDRLRIKLEGMDLMAACPNHMNPPLSYIDPSNVGSVQVYAGIAPVSVGGDAIGGAIVVEPLPPVFAAPGTGRLTTGQVGTYYRSNGDAAGANLRASYATETFNITYAGSIAQSDNYKAGGNFKNYDATGRPGHTLARDEVGSTAYETRNHELGVAWRGSGQLVEAKLGFQDMPYQLYPNQRMDMLDNTQHRINLRYLGQFAWGALEARAYHEKVDHYMDFGEDKKFFYGAPPYIVAPGMPMYTKSTNTGASIKASIDLGPRDLLRVGGELQNYHLDDWWPPSPASLAGMIDNQGRPATMGGMAPNTFWNINGGKRDRIGLFGEWERQIDAQWMGLVGARYERVKSDAGTVQGYNMNYKSAAFNAIDRKRSDDNWDLAAIARYTPDTTRSFEFGYAFKTRSPSLYERYPWSTSMMAEEMNNFVGDGNGYLGNPDLRHEMAHTFAATFDLHAADREWEFKATPYYSRVNNFIDAVQWNNSANAPATTLARNQFVILRYANQSARLYGLDLSGKMPLAKTGVGRFGLRGLLNYTNGKNRDTGDHLYNIMPLNAKLALTHQYERWSSGLEVQMVKRKSQVSDVRNELQTPGYALFNLRSSYRWKNVRVDFGVENLFDKLYFHPLGGAYVGQGATMSFNREVGTIGANGGNASMWGTGVPGMGRSVYAGLTMDF